MNFSKDNKFILIFLLSSLVVMLVIGMNIHSFSKIESTLNEQVNKNIQIKTEFISKQIEHHIMQVREGLITLSQFPILKSLNIDDYENNQNSVHVVHANVDSKTTILYRTNVNGSIIDISKPQFQDLINLNIKDKKYFQIPKNTNQPYVTSLKQNSVDQIIVSVPLYETNLYTPYPDYNNKFRGVLIGAIDIDLLYNLYIHPNIDESNDLILITDENGEIILQKGINIKNSQNILNNDDNYSVSYSQIIIGNEIWNLKLISSKNIFSNIKSVKNRHLFNLAFISLILVTFLVYTGFMYKSREDTRDKLNKANITLEKLGIGIDEEESAFNVSDIKLDDKKIYLLKDDDENTATELFLSKLNDKYSGLGIIREDIDNFKKQYNLEKTSFIWLSENKSKKYHSEFDFNKIYLLIEEFVKKSKKSVILIDKLDYILTKNEFNNVLERIYDLKDLLLHNQSTIILSLNSSVLSSNKLELIEKETSDIYGKDLTKKINLTNSEKKCLELINFANINSNMITYKDISAELNITKPTTRTKIDKLQRLNLITIDKVGRYKTLKITSRGRKLL